MAPVLEGHGDNAVTVDAVRIDEGPVVVEAVRRYEFAFFRWMGVLVAYGHVKGALREGRLGLVMLQVDGPQFIVNRAGYIALFFVRADAFK